MGLKAGFFRNLFGWIFDESKESVNFKASKTKPFMEETAFVSNWDSYMEMGSVACVIIGVLILLYHEFRVMQIKDYKEKYDYVNLNEVRFFWYAVLAVVVAFPFYANSVYTSKIFEHTSILWCHVRLFLTISLVTIPYFLLYT